MNPQAESKKGVRNRFPRLKRFLTPFLRPIFVIVAVCTLVLIAVNRLVTVWIGRQGREVFVGEGKANLIKVWDLFMRTLVREFPLPNAKFNEFGNKNEHASWSGFMVSADGKYFAMERGGDPAEIFSGVDGTLVAAVPRGLSAFRSAFLPNQDFYLSTSNITRAVKTGNALDVVAYDIKQQKVVAAFRGHEKADLQMAVSANGKVLACGNEEGNVLIWDLDHLK